ARVLAIEADDVGDRADWAAARIEVRGEVGDELVEEEGADALEELRCGGELDRIDDDRAERSERVDRGVDERALLREKPALPAEDADPRAADAGRAPGSGALARHEVRRRRHRRLGGRRIARVGAGDRGEEEGRVGDGARDRAGGV